MFQKKLSKILPLLFLLIFSGHLIAVPIAQEDVSIYNKASYTLKKDTTLLNQNGVFEIPYIDISGINLPKRLENKVSRGLEFARKYASDSLFSAQDTIVNNASLQSPTFSLARDSVIEDFSNGKKIIYYYGDVSVKYDNIELKSDYMAYNVDTKTVFASGLPDTLGVIVGKPEMKEGDKSYAMDEVSYNFESRKAKILNVKTQEEEGYLHGEFLKKMPDNSMNISNGKYTTCDCEHPHFYLKMTTAKMMTKPTQRIVFGPAYVVLEDVPTPFALPFGFVPKRPERASGLLMPTYGEEMSRGFFLRGLGYYFVLGDFWDFSLTGDIYSLGSWAGNLNSRYKKRYKYSGDLAISYSNDQTGEKNSTDFFQSKNFSFRWSHSQDSKARPGTSFRASVNFSSPSNNQFNSVDIDQSLQNQISSSISYSKTWQGSPFSLSVNMLHSQSSRDSSYSVTLPNLTFTVNRFYPFKSNTRVGKEKFYESFALSYSATAENRINFKASDVNKPDFWGKMKNGVKHNFTIGLPSFSLLKYIQIAPSVQYGMNWYFQDMNKVYNEETNKVEENYSKQFGTFGVTQEFSAGVSASTRVYGTFDFGKGKMLEAMRHMITPSLSFSYRPDLGIPINGYSSLNYVDINGMQQMVDYNKYSGQIYSPPSSGKNAGISFSLGNNLEAKVRDKKDTSAAGVKKLKLIDQLALGASYNLLADSMNLSNININMNTTIFGKLGLNANAVLDPYAINERGQRIAQYNIVKEGGFNLARLTTAGVSLSYSFAGKKRDKKGGGVTQPPAGGTQPPPATGTGKNVHSSQNSDYTRIYYHPVTGEYIPGGWLYYLDPDVPWSINLNYNYTYSKSYQYANDRLHVKHNHMQTLGISGQIRFTKDFNININTGIDVTKMKLTTTQLSATYDLHCFQISVSWIPNGQWESWSFRINAKASALADLLQFKKNASYWDN